MRPKESIMATPSFDQLEDYLPEFRGIFETSAGKHYICTVCGQVNAYALFQSFEEATVDHSSRQIILEAVCYTC